MSKLATAAKRVLVGRPFRSERLNRTLLRKRIALPVFGSNTTSSVAYAPEQIFLVLSVAGISAYTLTPWAGLGVAVVVLVVVASYRQMVRAYPAGGGDYQVTTANLGPSAAIVVASALLVDYVLTVAVAISVAVANLGSVLPVVGAHTVTVAVVAIVALTAVNLRGIRESKAVFAIPSYAFMLGVVALFVWGFTRLLVLGEEVRAESADFDLVAESEPWLGVALALLVLRAISVGCVALSGVEEMGNRVPGFQKPKSANAAGTLLILGFTSVIMLLGLSWLAWLTEVRLAMYPDRQLIGAPEDYQQATMLAQVARAVFEGFPPGFYFLIAVTVLILLVAANTAFNGFPMLGAVLAQDRYLPRQLHTRGDRLAYSNGIVFLAGAAILLVIAFQADVTRLIHLYIVGVFVSFTLSQLGMVRHWTRQLRPRRSTGSGGAGSGADSAAAAAREPATTLDAAERRRIRRYRVVNTVGTVMTGSALLVVLVTSFTDGAWLALAALALILLVMRAIRAHYDRVAAELAPRATDAVLPSRNHAIVLVSTLHLPTLRALSYARATRPDVLEAVTANVDDASTRALVADWEAREMPVPLKVVESPYREITKPVLDYVKRVRSNNPRNVVTVFIPEYVVGHWWEQILHNQSALRLKGRLLFEPGVMVTSVPWQLRSSARHDEETDPFADASRARDSPPRARDSSRHRSPEQDSSGRRTGQS